MRSPKKQTVVEMIQHKAEAGVVWPTLSTEVEKQKREQLLALVVEILPGQAGEGLLEVLRPAGTFETKEN